MILLAKALQGQEHPSICLLDLQEEPISIHNLGVGEKKGAYLFYLLKRCLMFFVY